MGVSVGLSPPVVVRAAPPQFSAQVPPMEAVVTIGCKAASSQSRDEAYARRKSDGRHRRRVKNWNILRGCRLEGNGASPGHARYHPAARPGPHPVTHVLYGTTSS